MTRCPPSRPTRVRIHAPTTASSSSPSTRRVLTRVDGELRDAVVGAWMRTRVGLLGGRRVIAVDGKTVRGARAAGNVAPHLVAALDHTLGGRAGAGAGRREEQR